MRERLVERHLMKRVKEAGGLCFKMDARLYAGIPDRLVLLPVRGFWFVELKAPGQTLRPNQVAFARRLLKMCGIIVVVLDSKEAVDEFIKERT